MSGPTSRSLITRVAGGRISVPSSLLTLRCERIRIGLIHKFSTTTSCSSSSSSSQANVTSKQDSSQARKKTTWLLPFKWNWIWSFVVLLGFVGSQNINVMKQQDDYNVMKRRWKAKAELLRETIMKVQAGKEVNIGEELRTGIPKEDEEWTELVKLFENGGNPEPELEYLNIPQVTEPRLQQQQQQECAQKSNTTTWADQREPDDDISDLGDFESLFGIEHDDGKTVDAAVSKESRGRKAESPNAAEFDEHSQLQLERPPASEPKENADRVEKENDNNPEQKSALGDKFI
ncbi:hypothetical protein V1514DRAFT_340090 [Lipomyces japonicus]|uniref:uncharacterized protein n=1 Tax=Lipomyces japonicus TaxID=56871 RepID=UPI0034CD6305